MTTCEMNGPSSLNKFDSRLRNVWSLMPLDVVTNNVQTRSIIGDVQVTNKVIGNRR